MKHFILFFISILLVVLSCSHEEVKQEGVFLKEEGKIILPQKSFYKERVKLTELFSSIEVIPLEASSSSMIAQAHKVYFNEEKVIIFDIMLDRIIIFDRSGKFINTLFSGGRGPGEFMRITDVYVDFINEYIIVNDRSLLKVLFFDLNGEFVKERNISVIADELIVDFFGNIIFHRNNHFPIDYTFEGQEMNIAILDRTNFEVINEFYPANPKFRHWRPRSLSTFSKKHQDSTILFVNFFDYNIYSITKDDFSVKYSVIPTDNTTNFNEIFHDTPMPGEASRRLANTNTARWLSSIYENENYIHFDFRDSENRNVLVDKNRKRALVYTGFENDLADHELYRAVFGIYDNNLLLMGRNISEAKLVREYGNCCLHDARELDSSLNDDDNPVLIIGKLDPLDIVFH